MPTSRRDFLRQLAGASATALLGACTSSRENAAKPNIVLIMADDMGFSDLGCYGGEIATPVLDRLAANGLRFTQFYNTARCCPTRASLMTGLYPHQAGVGHMMGDDGLPGYRGNLSKNAVTIAEVLKTAGYRTAMSGKWHVTPIGEQADRSNWPRQRGFDRYFGTIHGAGSFYDPVSLTLDNDPVEPGPDFYYTDAIADHAVEFIDEFGGAREAPFFLYLAFTAPHWPLHALDADIAKYENRYDAGYDALRAERHQRMIGTGLVKAEWPLTPRDEAIEPWEKRPHKEWEARRMEVYAAQVDRMDQAIGRIVAKLESERALDNTLILFLADNGGCAEELRAQGAGAHFPEKTRDGQPVQRGNDPAVMPGPATTYQSYGVPWANASNTPFRLYKHWVHEGGIASPLIAHWPRVIKRANELTHAPGHLIDIMATCADIAGARYPDQFEGRAITPLEGKSLKPVFETGTRDGHEAIYWEHEGNRAIRMGRWKLVSKFPGDWELFDLEADRTEMRNLAADQPDRVREMAAQWEAWAQRCNVVDWNEIQRIRAAGRERS